MSSISLDEVPNSSSTPIKSESLKEMSRLRGNNPSVEDLLHAIDKNISSASLDYLDSTNNSQISDDPSPIRPLNLKQQSQKSINAVLSTASGFEPQESDDRVMEDIPKVPSFDELEYNTRINRTLSLSKLHGPRQLSNSVQRSSSAKLATSESSKSIGAGLLTRDNSPSKKSVCFEESPPKVMEYHQLTPEHSDESYGENTEDSLLPENTFESKWDSSIKRSFHPLPPLPPKHTLPTIPVATSPQKETTLGSSDEDSQDFNLTKEELLKDRLSLEERLDLVLENQEISERVQHDESFRGSGSPLKSMTKKEEEFIYSIKTKRELEDEQCLKDAADLFETDVRNNDKDSTVIRLNPFLKRKSSNNSLKDEERSLKTDSHLVQLAPAFISDGFKNVSTDDLISQSTMDSYASASEIIEYVPQPITKSHQSSNSISTLQDVPESPTRSHKKSISLSESISSGISFFSSIIHKRGDSKEVKLEAPDNLELPLEGSATPTLQIGAIEGEPLPSTRQEDSRELVIPAAPETTDNLEHVPVSGSQSLVKEEHEGAAPIPEAADKEAAETNDTQLSASASIQSSIDIHVNSPQLPIDEPQPDPLEKLSLLDNQTREATPSFQSDESEIVIEHLTLDPPLGLGEEPELSFSEEIKGTGLFNSSDVLTDDYRSLAQIDLKSVLSNDKVTSTPEAAPVFSEATSLPEQAEYVDVSTKAAAEVNPQAGSDTGVLVQLEAADQLYPIEPISPFEEIDSYIKDEELQDEVPLDDELNHVLSEDHGTFIPSRVKPEPSLAAKLPSFNSLLFHDKEPEETSFTRATPPTDYISIWHSQPVPEAPGPQYTVRQRKVSPPKKVLRLLQRTISDARYHDDDTESSIQVKSETSRTSIDIRRKDSFVATSFSRSSYINLDSSRRSSALYEIKRDPDSSVLSHGESFSGPFLPDLTNGSSDFATAFKDWEVEPTASTEQRTDAPTDKPNFFPEPVREIWGSVSASAENSRTPSVDQGKIQSMIAQSIPNGEQPRVKSSNAAAEVVVVKNEDEGIEIEIDHGDSLPNIPDITTAESTVPEYKLVSTPKTAILETNKPIINESFKPVERRFISGQSEASGFDLNDEFDRCVQLQGQNYSVREKKEVIVANGQVDVLDYKDLDEEFVPKADSLSYEKSRKSAIRKSSASERSPLSLVPDTAINSESRLPSNIVGARIVSNNESAPNRIVSAARSENNFVGGDLVVKKRETVEEQIPPQQHESFELPSNDKGRLYIHINSLDSIQLDEIKQHKPSFKLYVDNGKHTISTAKLELQKNVLVDKEFELAINEPTTELYFTLKVVYSRPENELVEVYEKIPLTNNRFSRLIGTKPKYRVEKSYVTRKRTSDSWDNKFANDGSFGKNKIVFDSTDNGITGKTAKYTIELFNEWTTDAQAGQKYKRTPYLIGKLDVSMLYIPRTSPLESLPPSIKVAQSIADYLLEQSSIRFEGFLFQEGGDCDLWKRRYFKVEGTKLIAHHESTRKPRAQINLLKVVDIMHSGKKRDPVNRRSYTDEVLMSDSFKLSFRNGEIISLNAETTSSKNEWIRVLERVVELNKFHQPWVNLLVKNNPQKE